MTLKMMVDGNAKNLLNIALNAGQITMKVWNLSDIILCYHQKEQNFLFHLPAMFIIFQTWPVFAVFTILIGCV